MWYTAGTGPYKFETVCVPVRFDKLVDVSVGHPFRHHRELVVIHCHSQQWQYILMTKSFPGDDFLTESLCDWSTHTLRRNWKPTFLTLIRSLVVHIFSTFTATSTPSCSPFHTSPNPPRHRGASVRLWHSGICIDLGIKA